MGPYSASKAGLRGMSRSFAAEFSPRRIRVNVVAPGPIKTPIWEPADIPPEAVAGVAKKMQSAAALNRFGEAEELAKVVLILASDDSSYIRGPEIVVDGGTTGAPFGAPVYR
jgi:NAD(P)-dependent dehydrogenase (short-subunit alcohol dehydrogenase family)